MSNTGYLHRIAPYTAEQALALAKQLQQQDKGQKVWWVSASQQWDVEKSDKPNVNLRPFTLFNPADAKVFKGDFGRIFCKGWELRWKRLDDGQYDLLILTEQTDLALPAEARRLCPQYTTKASGKHNLLVHNPEPEDHKQQLIDYVEYLAENQAVVFVRYQTLREEL